MIRTTIITGFFLLISTTLLSQSTDKKTSTATRKYYPPAGLYMAPSTATDSTVQSLFLMIDGRAGMANTPWPLRGDTSLRMGTYQYDARKHAVQIRWERGTKTEWIPIQKDSSLTLTGLNYRLAENADSIEARNQRSRIEAGIEK